MSWPGVTMVDACVRRDGRVGSPTAVTEEDPAATDADRGAVAAAAGTSHAALLGPGRTPDGGWPVRFFTATAELSGCGHGTVAAQAVRLTRTGRDELTDRQHTGGRTFDTVAIRRPAGIEVWFDQGLVVLRHPAPDERAAIVDALGLTADDPHPTDAPRIAAPGAPRMLVPDERSSFHLASRADAPTHRLHDRDRGVLAGQSLRQVRGESHVNDACRHHVRRAVGLPAG